MLPEERGVQMVQGPEHIYHSKSWKTLLDGSYFVENTTPPISFIAEPLYIFLYDCFVAVKEQGLFFQMQI